MKAIDLTGQTFGELEVLKRGESVNRRATWVCRCSCGRETTVRGVDLRRGHTRSCGCVRSQLTGERSRIHGDRHGEHSRLYNIWTLMKKRCLSPSCPAYRRYGGRGVHVCAEWMEYPAFKEWALANGYARNLTIDRIDVDGGYCPENCRWVTKSENSRRVEHLPQDVKQAVSSMVIERRPVPEIVQKTGVSAAYVYNMREKLGVSRNLRKRRAEAMRVCVRGLWSVGASVQTICKALGFSYDVVYGIVRSLKAEKTIAPA